MKPRNAKITAKHQFKINTKYSNKRTKVSLYDIQPTSNKEEKKEDEDLEEHRKMHLQAAIMRIMKARKQLSHKKLMEETRKAIENRFNPSVAFVKKCIDILADKGMLERDAKKQEYTYVA